MKKIVSIFLQVSLVLIFSQSASAQVAKTVFQGRFEKESNLIESGKYRPYELGFTSQDEVFRCESTNFSEPRGVSQYITLEQNKPMPLIASLESRAENIEGSQGPDYSLYLDIAFTDGTHEWGKSAPFSVGTHDWEKKTVVFFPDKPIRGISFYGLFRSHRGTAYFRNFELKTLSLDENVHLFDGVPILTQQKPPSFRKGQGYFMLRDVKKSGDFQFLREEALQVRFSRTTPGPNLQEITLENLSGEDRALSFYYVIPFEEQKCFSESGERFFHEHPRSNVPVEAGREYSYTRTFEVGSNGRLSRYPFAAVGIRENELYRGHAVGIDMSFPAYFRTAYNDASRELYVAYDIALTPEKPTAVLRVCDYSFEGLHGFRDALQKYYELFPGAFEVRIAKHGIWMPFDKISNVQGWEDFGFMFKEGNNETKWDDEQGILTFRYTEPMTWWMPIPEGEPRTLETAWEQARKLADSGNVYAKALLQSAMHDAKGRAVAQILDTPWCNGAVWSMNDAPGIEEPNGFSVKWNEKIFEQNYGPQRNGDLDGEYIDSSEGYVSAVLDFRRDHFAGMQTPLTFSQGSLSGTTLSEDPQSEFQAAVYRGLVAFEYVRAIEQDMRKAGKLMMANSTPDHICWLAPLLDIMGTETDWNHTKRWNPMSGPELLYRRVLCKGKPYCFLMNTDFDHFTHEMNEKFMKRSTAYGIFPGFFSANASEKTYFSNPELYNRDRDLFRKYIPVCKMLSEAAWEPVPCMKSDDPQVHVERFGTRFWTIFNDSGEEKTVRISRDRDFERILQGRGEKFRELLGDRVFSMEPGFLELKIGPEDLAVFQWETPSD